MIVIYWVEFVLMNGFKEKVSVFLEIIRAYSLSISITSWFVAFLYSGMRGGSLKYGILAFFGIVFLHSATNLFDDIIDYTREKAKIKKGLQNDFNFQNAKCRFLRSGEHKLSDYYKILFFLCAPPALIGLYFLHIYGTALLPVIVPTAFLCLLYPVLGCLGAGEILVALIFSPLLYTGVNFVMTGGFTSDILILSISTGLLCVAVLHNHMLLDFNLDEKSRKITLCRICATKERALALLAAIISGAYVNILVCVMLGYLNIIYLTVFLSFPTAVTLIDVMRIHIKDPEKEIKYNIFMGDVREAMKLPDNRRGFLLKFLIVRNVLNHFTLCLCAGMIAECIL